MKCEACHCSPMPKDPKNEFVCPSCGGAQPNWQGYYFGGVQSYENAAELRALVVPPGWGSSPNGEVPRG